ncbi:Uncharacterized protein Fot_43081 [Forsythia ovata]|uniref:Uncharacterized protein n=1 Tax=Forsythia ovata TaxID=205694 RepID=A0ABD1RRY0_9LAMI
MDSGSQILDNIRITLEEDQFFYIKGMKKDLSEDKYKYDIIFLNKPVPSTSTTSTTTGSKTDKGKDIAYNTETPLPLHEQTFPNAFINEFHQAVDTAEVTELMKLAEMYTSRNHVLNCELYKMLEMRVAEIQSALGEDENAEAMRAEVKRLRARLAFSEDARSRATYDVTKAQTIQKACVVAQKKAESQLKSCQNMIQAKDRELTEVPNELAKAKGLLAKLGVPGYTETQPKFVD